MAGTSEVASKEKPLSSYELDRLAWEGEFLHDGIPGSTRLSRLRQKPLIGRRRIAFHAAFVISPLARRTRFLRPPKATFPSGLARRCSMPSRVAV
jgi:hypothetical protein